MRNFIVGILVLIILIFVLSLFPFFRGWTDGLVGIFNEKKENVTEEYDRVKGEVEEIGDKITETKEKVESTIDTVSEAVEAVGEAADKVSGVLGDEEAETEETSAEEVTAQ
ncbi:MAG: hypothetical protein OEY44_03315 [Candidatus Peregrinibacteria bacterium]|nr:hypothetical protein [Candidatus Peregrinibacteria bacterium]